MRVNVDRLLTALLTAATVTAATLLVWRELRPSRSAAPRADPPSYVRDWRNLPIAATVGNPRSPVRVIAFTDFECPFCRRYHEVVLPLVQHALPDSVSWSVVHFPLAMHKFAREAAIVFECSKQNSGAEKRLIDVLFAKQDSFGLKAWSQYVMEAGISDTAGIERCRRARSRSAMVDSGVAAAEEVGVRGTPGIMVNGWLFSSPPSHTALVQYARRLLLADERLP